MLVCATPRNSMDEHVIVSKKITARVYASLNFSLFAWNQLIAFLLLRFFMCTQFSSEYALTTKEMLSAYKDDA